MEAIQFWGKAGALYGKQKKIVFDAEAFDKAFLHHLFIKIRWIKMKLWKEAGEGRSGSAQTDSKGGIEWKRM